MEPKFHHVPQSKEFIYKGIRSMSTNNEPIFNFYPVHLSTWIG
jgi:hypothetical protein